MLAPHARRVILFHVVARGRAWIETVEGERHWASAGDVIVLPYGDSHRMGGTEPAVCVAVSTLIDPPPWERMPVIHHGAGGAETHLVCGYLACDDPLFDPRMRALPPVFVVRPDGAARPWVPGTAAGQGEARHRPRARSIGLGRPGSLPRARHFA